jgi:hypothetical protein
LYKRKTADLPDAILKVVGTSRAASFDAKDFLDSIIREWGGIENFAADIVSDMRSASLGPTAKTRYYEMINRLIIYVTSSMPQDAPVSEMDDSSLLAATSEAVNNLIKKGVLNPEEDSPNVKDVSSLKKAKR